MMLIPRHQRGNQPFFGEPVARDLAIINFHHRYLSIELRPQLIAGIDIDDFELKVKPGTNALDQSSNFVAQPTAFSAI